MRFRAIAFDIDGTMYPNNAMYFRSIPFAIANFRLLKALESARKAMRLQSYEGSFHEVQARLTARLLGMGVTECKALIDQKIYHEWELSLRGIGLSKGFRECIKGLHDHGLPLGVLSDFPVGRKLSILGIPDGWNCALSTETVGKLKPDPAGFIALANAMGENPKDILYVGNSYSYDVLGAKAAGMPVAHFARSPRKGTVADFTFSHYGELLSWIVGGQS